MKKQLLQISLLALAAFSLGSPLQAQIVDPIKWETELKMVSEHEAEIIFNATIDAGWHLYSTDIPDGGPTPATITMETTEGVELNGDFSVRVRAEGGEWLSVPSYLVKVDEVRGTKHCVENASMAIFDFTGRVEVAVTYNK